MTGAAQGPVALSSGSASWAAGAARLRSATRQPRALAWTLTAAMTLAALVLVLLLTPRWRAQAADALAAQAERATRAGAPSGGRDRAADGVMGGEGIASGHAAPARVLPEAHLLDRRLTALTRQARRLGVEVRSMAESIDAGGHLQLALGLRAEYPALRRFIAAALAADPALSLDQLRAERASENESVLEIQLRWTFWQRPPAGEPRRDGP